MSVLTAALGTSVAAAFATLYADIESKMSRELRAYGANFVLKPADRGTLRDDVLATLGDIIPADRLLGAQRFLYGLVRVKRDRIAAVGIDFSRIAITAPYWQLTGSLPVPGAGPACLLGQEAAAALHIEVGAQLVLEHEKRTHRCVVSALVETGGAEDGQVFLPIDDARSLLGRVRDIDLVLASIVANADEAEGFAAALEQRVAGSKAHPIHKLSRSEGLVLARIRSVVLMAVLLIGISTLVGLLISFMATVSERRKEVALMKALGATDRGVGRHFLVEVAATGLAGGLGGLAVGIATADFMERTLFGTAVSFHWWLAPPILALAIVLCVAGAVMPLRALAAVQPAVVLKGE